MNSLSIKGLLGNLITEAHNTSTSIIEPIEFIEEFIFNGEEKLYPTQKAIIKSFYGLTLSVDEQQLLQTWHEKDRTTWIEGRQYVNLVIEAGRRSSKTTIVSCIVLYEFYKLIATPNINKKYNLLPNSPIAILLISRSFDQVKQTLFAQIKGYIEYSDYFKPLIEQKKVLVQAESILYPDKNISILPKHTQSRSIVGYSIKLLVIDEVARFEYDDNGVSKADDIWDNIGKATQTFGSEGYKIAISSAWEQNDAIQQLWNLAKKEVSTLGFRLRTWDINLNPNLTEAALKSSSDYKKDPVKAALEYEGIRYQKSASFLIPENVDLATRGVSAIDAHQVPLQIKNQEDIRYYSAIQIDRITTLTEGISFLHCDYGVKKDSAAVAIARPEIITNSEGLNFKIIIDAYLVWKPYWDRDSSNRAIHRIVSFLNIENIIEEVCRKRKVRMASFDSYQSQHTIQKLHSIGITTREMGVSNSQQLAYFTLLKQLIDRNCLVLPQDSNWSVLARRELVNLIRNKKNRIDHPSDGSKDLADAIANSVYNCYQYLIKNGFTFSTHNSSNFETITSVNYSKNSFSFNTNNSIQKIKNCIKSVKR